MGLLQVQQLQSPEAGRLAGKACTASPAVMERGRRPRPLWQMHREPRAGAAPQAPLHAAVAVQQSGAGSGVPVRKAVTPKRVTWRVPLEAIRYFSKADPPLRVEANAPLAHTTGATASWYNVDRYKEEEALYAEGDE